MSIVIQPAKTNVRTKHEDEHHRTLIFESGDGWTAVATVPTWAAEEIRRLQQERDRDMLTVERLTNLIDGYAWLAEGRGPYAYDDGRYDDDVMHFVGSLVEALANGGRWQNIQHFMSEYESLKTKLAHYE